MGVCFMSVDPFYINRFSIYQQLIILNLNISKADDFLNELVIILVLFMYSVMNLIWYKIFMKLNIYISFFVFAAIFFS